MKRSEMELFIEQIIIEHHGYKDTNCLLANNILKNIEEAGMLPPLQDHIYPRLFKRDNEYVNIDSLEWEPEDD